MSYKASNLKDKSINFNNGIIAIIISLYLLIEWAPKLEIQDQMGIHWLLLSALNICSAIYIFRSKIINDQNLTSIFKNAIVILFIIFFFISGLSLFVAINPVEGIVAYSRLFTVVSTFLIFTIFFFNRLELLKNIALIITVFALFQAFDTISHFYQNVGKGPINELIYNLQGTSGNKNIWAAGFVLKIPFIIYCIFTREGFLKILGNISVALSFFTIFLINARAAYLGTVLELLVLLGLFAYIFFKEKKINKYLSTSFFIISVFIGGLLLSQHSLDKATKDGNTGYGSVTSRLQGIADITDASSNIRIAYWKGSIDLIQKRPLIGVGYGNWKLFTPLYVNTLIDDNVFSKHPHNDFIEIAGETGILNALIFLSIFIVAFILTLKLILSKQSIEAKMISAIAFAIMSGYFVDAFFNFPAERPNIQLLFALALSIIVTNWLAEKQTVSRLLSYKFFNIFSLIIIIIGLGATYVSYMVYKSSRVQYLVDNDLASMGASDQAMPKYKYDEINLMFPKIPNIGENSESIGFKKARYLHKEKRFDEAIKLLDSVHYQSPYIMYNESLKCIIYLEQNKIDSAFKYAKIAAYAKPRSFPYYRTASYLAGINNDVPEINSLFKNYNKYRKDQQSWSFYALSLFKSNADRSEVKFVVGLGLRQYPTDETMLNLRSDLPKELN